MLTKRQKLTIEHLKHIQNITSPEDIIAFCQDKLSKPYYGSARFTAKKKGLPSPTRTQTRRKSLGYYQGIINHYQGLI